MEPEISEFSYGYALTFELMDKFALKPTGSPEFATQNAEGKAGGGWDMKLPALPIYLQFKRSYRMERRNAIGADAFSSLPFYRMKLHRLDKSKQQALLLDLEAKGNLVRYAAPGFSRSSELHEFYSLDIVSENSVFISPAAIGLLPDDKEHSIGFQTSPPQAVFCSDPIPIECQSGGVVFGDVAAELVGETDRRLGDGFFERIGDELLSIYEERLTDGVEADRFARIRSIRERSAPPEFSRAVANTLYDCELLILSAGAVNK